MMRQFFILMLLLVGVYSAGTASAQQFVHNVTADSIVIPPKGALLPRNNCPVEIKFTNNGLENEDNIRVIMVFKGRFSVSTDTVIIPTLYSGQSETVRFDPIKQTDPVFDTIYGIVSFQNDENHKDDTISQSYRSSCPSNIQTSLVTSPPLDTIIYPNSHLLLSAVLSWWGEFTTSKSNVKVRVQIRNWPENFLQVQIDTVIPEISFYKNNVNVVFPSKQGIYNVSNLQKGTYRISATSLLADDCDRTNDTAFSYFTITDKVRESDILIDTPLSPGNNTHFDTNVVPIKIRLRNDGTSKGLKKTFIATIKSSTDVVIYRDTIFIPVLGLRSILDTQFTDLVISRKGPYYPEYKLEIAATPPNEDQSWRDTVKSVFTIGEPLKVKLLAITYPAQGDTITAGTVIKPQVWLRALWGDDFKEYRLKIKIENLNHYNINNYWPIYVCDTAMPDITTDSYPHQFTFPVPRSDEFGVDSISRALSGNHRLTCYIFSDSNQVQDSSSIVFYVNGRTLDPYITIDSILYPGNEDTIKQTTQYSQVLIRNSGPIDVPYIVVRTEISHTDGSQKFTFQDTIKKLLRGDSMILKQGPFNPRYLGRHTIETHISCDTLPHGLYYYYSGNYHSFIVVKKTSSSTDRKQDGANLLDVRLPFPNPFSAKTTLNYEVASSGYITMRILDVAGVTMKTIMSDEFVSEGKHEVTLDGSHLPGGTNFVEMVFKDASGISTREIQPVTVKR